MREGIADTLLLFEDFCLFQTSDNEVADHTGDNLADGDEEAVDEQS